MKVLKLILFVVGILGALMGLLVLLGDTSAWDTFLEFEVISVALILYGRSKEKPGTADSSSSTVDHLDHSAASDFSDSDSSSSDND